MSTTNVGIELGSPTLVNLARFPGTYEILERSCQDHGKIGFTMYFNVVCICFCLIGSLVIVQGQGTCTLAGLIMQMNHM